MDSLQTFADARLDALASPQAQSPIVAVLIGEDEDALAALLAEYVRPFVRN
jgi:hypothetical protein